jgi:signal transduction histidine kinase
MAPRPERAKTDESLRLERERSDKEHATRRDTAEADADASILLSRERVAALLRAERILADEMMSMAKASEAKRLAVTEERERQDRYQKEQYRQADEASRIQRAQEHRSMADLVGTERRVTDSSLAEERIRADELIGSHDKFLATVAHDLRNYLGAISLDSSVVLESADTPMAIQAAQRIRKNATTMGLLVRDLLDVVAIEAGILAIHPRECDATELVEDVKDILQPIASAKGVALITKIPGKPVPAKLDPLRIHQVLSNLVTNSIRFTPSAGSIEIELIPEPACVQFAVADTGCGIEKGKLDSIFQRLERPPSPDHLGLGLYIARGIVSSHGGKTWAESRPDKGTRVAFSLPVALPGK